MSRLALSPLFDPEQERSAISVLLRDYGRFLALGLTERHFTVAQHVAVIQAADRLADSGAAVTFEALALELQRAGMDRLIGGQEGILELRRGAPGTVLDVQRLRKLTSLRAVREALVEGAELAGREDLQGALAKLDGAMTLGKLDSTVLGLRQLCELALEQGSSELQARKRIIYPGSEALEEVLTGFRPGGMYVLGALSNVGKSMIAQTWALNCVRHGLVVGWVSLEDPILTTGSRALGMLANVEPQRIETGAALSTSEERMRLERGHGQAMEFDGRFLYTDLTGQTELDVCAAMSVMAARGAKLVIVDYVGVITSSKDQQDRRNEVRYVAIRLKAQAKRLGIALLLISQLTMPRDDVGVAREPSKYSLRESGDLTNAAEAIILAWRLEESDNAEINLVMSKGKSGGVGKHWTMQRDESTQQLVETSRPQYRKKQKPAVRGFSS